MINKCYCTPERCVDRIVELTPNPSLRFGSKQAVDLFDCTNCNFRPSELVVVSYGRTTTNWWQRWDRYYTLTTVEKETF